MDISNESLRFALKFDHTLDLSNELVGEASTKQK